MNFVRVQGMLCGCIASYKKSLSHHGVWTSSTIFLQMLSLAVTRGRMAAIENAICDAVCDGYLTGWQLFTSSL